MRAVSQRVPKLLLSIISLKIILLESMPASGLLYFPGMFVVTSSAVDCNIMALTQCVQQIMQSISCR